MTTAKATVLGETNTTVRGKLARFDLANGCFGADVVARRTLKLTAEKRREIASKAARARWAKQRKKD